MYMWYFFTCATSGEGTAYACSASELTPGWCGVRFAPSLVFCVVFYSSLFGLSFLTIVMSLLWFTNADDTFSILKLFILLVIIFSKLQEIKKLNPWPNTEFAAVCVKSKFNHQIDTHDINVLQHYA